MSPPSEGSRKVPRREGTSRQEREWAGVWFNHALLAMLPIILYLKSNVKLYPLLFIECRPCDSGSLKARDFQDSWSSSNRPWFCNKNPQVLLQPMLLSFSANVSIYSSSLYRAAEHTTPYTQAGCLSHSPQTSTLSKIHSSTSLYAFSKSSFTTVFSCGAYPAILQTPSPSLPGPISFECPPPYPSLVLAISSPRSQARVGKGRGSVR